MFIKELLNTTMENEYVLLRPVEKTDINNFAAIALDSQIWKYFTSIMSTLEDVVNFVEQAVRDQAEGNKFTYAIIDKCNNQIAGSSSYGNISEPDSRVEIGWSWLTPVYHGTGINSWSKYLLLQTAFESANAVRVEFKTDVLNIRARSALKKIGAVEEGILRSHTQMPHKRRRDTIFYSVLREEWSTVKKQLFEKGLLESAQ